MNRNAVKTIVLPKLAAQERRQEFAKMTIEIRLGNNIPEQFFDGAYYEVLPNIVQRGPAWTVKDWEQFKLYRQADVKRLHDAVTKRSDAKDNCIPEWVAYAVLQHERSYSYVSIAESGENNLKGPTFSEILATNDVEAQTAWRQEAVQCYCGEALTGRHANLSEPCDIPEHLDEVVALGKPWTRFDWYGIPLNCWLALCGAVIRRPDFFHHPEQIPPFVREELGIDRDFIQECLPTSNPFCAVKYEQRRSGGIDLTRGSLSLSLPSGDSAEVAGRD